MKALILAPFSDGWLERLRRRLEVVYEPWIETRKLQDPRKLAARLRDEDFAIVVVEADFLFEEVFAVPNLKLAAVCRKATNQIDLNAATRHSVPVIHTPGRNAVGVAELAIGLMIALARQIPRAHDYVSGGRWDDPMYPYINIRGRELA
ncbi:MAG: 3-phosphoglycerate dehydrogenase, partial [Dehalococcoidia bacterium]|nr:3-phosphoglycerate dehydrogenase [Dehalococcoidia bacterium]